MIASMAFPSESFGLRNTSTPQSPPFPWDLAKKGSRTSGRSAQRQRRMAGAGFMKSRIHRALSYTRPSSTFPLTVVIVVTSNPELMANMIARASSHQGSVSMRNGQRRVIRAKMNEYGISPGVKLTSFLKRFQILSLPRFHDRLFVAGNQRPLKRILGIIQDFPRSGVDLPSEAAYPILNVTGSGAVPVDHVDEGVAIAIGKDRIYSERIPGSEAFGPKFVPAS